MESAARLADLSARLRVGSALQKNHALTFHNDDELKSLVVLNRGSYLKWNCGLNRPESRLRTNVMSWLCKVYCPKYTPILDLVFHL